MKSIQRALIAAGLGILLQSAHAAPVTWAANGHEYEAIYSEGITWTAASAATAALGGGWHLATLTSAAEDAFVASLLPTSLPQRSHFWFGLTDVAVEGTYDWVTGEVSAYTNWAGGEPNNSGNEDYMALDLRSSTWAWNDAPDNVGQIYGFSRGYIIERTGTRTNVPEPGTLSLFGLVLLAGALSQRRRRAA